MNYREAKQAEAEKELPEGADNLATHQKEQRPNPDEAPIVAPLKDGAYRTSIAPTLDDAVFRLRSL